MEDSMPDDEIVRPDKDDTQPITSVSKSSMLPTPVSQSAAPTRGLQWSVRALWVVTFFVAILALASLAVNVLLATRLLAIRNEASAVLLDASRSLDNLAWQGMAFEFPISTTVNFEGDVPFQQDITFPFKGNIPINTVVNLPIDLGPLGTTTVQVPVNTTVPVDITVPVHVDQKVHVKTQVPVRMNVPVRLSPNDPPLKDLIAQARDWLNRFRKYL
jgi:hypothetical protein